MKSISKINDLDLNLFQARRVRQVVQVEIHNNFLAQISKDRSVNVINQNIC